MNKNYITFLPYSLEFYGMDTICGQEIIVPWESVEKEQIDRLIVANSGPGIDSVNFLTESGNMVMTIPET